MGFLAFMGATWLSIFAGLTILLAVACTFDRRGTEWPKWAGVAACIGVFCFWQYQTELWHTTKAAINEPRIWYYIAAYFVLGIGYSVIEFLLDIRRSKRFWADSWQSYAAKVNFRFSEFKRLYERDLAEYDAKQAKAKNALQRIEPVESESGAQPPPKPPLELTREKMVVDFITEYCKDFAAVHEFGYSHRIVKIAPTPDKRDIGPYIDRKLLAESIGCWTLLWPFYALSLIFGDLLTELWHTLADMLAAMSQRMVRYAFKDVFK